MVTNNIFVVVNAPGAPSIIVAMYPYVSDKAPTIDLIEHHLNEDWVKYNDGYHNFYYGFFYSGRLPDREELTRIKSKYEINQD